jgi:hypothetical protein
MQKQAVINPGNVAKILCTVNKEKKAAMCNFTKQVVNAYFNKCFKKPGETQRNQIRRKSPESSIAY